ncbi:MULTISPECIES: Rrf2 family transcriptional regulator [unclassified Psychrobacter]|uniref:Rrf2 family transcriptional regulator n=1 Tax=unclassified Psychrobacter TaxID=196806 RepID=UPI00071E84FD|nr:MULTISPECIES: Rrf2 family transcriptional regulator [unclassified Psychrobacter]OLF38246.1 Rrf2 family transcriptional regulator [Psychrobacter sp. Cmf 22.2]
MRLTNYSDYALRSLIYLAVRPEPEMLANISDIADSYHISKSHLTKIIHQLGQLGYIESVRGKNGGIRLAYEPKDINLGVLIKQIEPDFDLVECFATVRSNSQKPRSEGLPITFISEEDNKAIGCVITPACQLKGIFFEALTAFITVLEKYTLADVIDNKEELSQFLFS